MIVGQTKNFCGKSFSLVKILVLNFHHSFVLVRNVGEQLTDVRYRNRRNEPLRSHLLHGTDIYRIRYNRTHP